MNLDDYYQSIIEALHSNFSNLKSGIRNFGIFVKIIVEIELKCFVIN
jgi:hypothetical protein